MEQKNNKLPDKSRSLDFEVYKKMIESAIREYSSVTNPKLVIRLARSVSGLEIDDNGNVKNGASLEDFVELVEKMRAAFGPVTYLLAKKAITGIATKRIRKRLPDKIR